MSPRAERKFDAVLFDLLTALLDSWTLWNLVAGSPEEQTRLPKASPKRVAQSSGPLYADVISGEAPGRTGRDQITQYRPVGNWGLQFSSVGALVYRRAKEQGLGRMLPTEWFLQDIKN